MSSSAAPVSTADALRRRSREALLALAVQFVFGMGANLIGAPGDNSGAARVVAAIVLGLHILIGVGVIGVAVRVWMSAHNAELGQREALWALVVLAVTFLLGIGTMLTASGWLSFLMAVGFLAGAALYVRTLLIGSRSA